MKKFKYLDEVKDIVNGVESANEKDKKNIIDSMISLQNSPGWKWLEQELNKKINDRAMIILGEDNPNIINDKLNEKTFNYYDLLRIQRETLKELKNMPERIKGLYQKPIEGGTI